MKKQIVPQLSAIRVDNPHPHRHRAVLAAFPFRTTKIAQKTFRIRNLPRCFGIAIPHNGDREAGFSSRRS
ncbi:hypothetical protein [uncultured Alistipes sp.]|uniref:hypothetical protein n=1 Tax=uncultured Alistipes sp. TaxID=538949 RepID=UPI0026087F00|nr:hypothetical protein [uncultured Alistipes sp.]